MCSFEIDIKSLALLTLALSPRPPSGHLVYVPFPYIHRLIYVLGTRPISHFSYIGCSRRLQMSQKGRRTTMRKKLRHWKCSFSVCAAVVAPVHSLKEDKCGFVKLVTFPVSPPPLRQKSFHLALMDDRHRIHPINLPFNRDPLYVLNNIFLATRGAGKNMPLDSGKR